MILFRNEDLKISFFGLEFVSNVLSKQYERFEWKFNHISLPPVPV